ncbi:hypothetical protein MPSEU_000027900 [Mayamaea pseudoterrestris]|nr:hypothetical protein MPSEU_000027900 [Mayamaea pseudoterrestris]
MPATMRVKLPTRCYQQLQSEGSPVKQPRMLGLNGSNKAKSCKFLSFGSNGEEFDVNATFTLNNRSEHASTNRNIAANGNRPPRTTRPPLSLPSSGKQMSIRKMFSSREMRTDAPKSCRNLKQAERNPVGRKTRRQKSVAASFAPKLVRIEENLPSGPKSMDFDISTDAAATIAPPSLRRARSAPQTSKSYKNLLEKGYISKSKKESIQKVQLFLAEMNYGTSTRDEESTIKEVPSAKSKPKSPLRNPYETLPTLSSSRRKVKPVKTMPLNTTQSTNKHLPSAATSVTPSSTTTKRHPTINTSMDNSNSKHTSLGDSLKSISSAYKQIMVEFGDESSEATTGW